MDALELLLTRRSCVVRNMVPPGPSDAELTQILQAGIRVPDHGKLYPWRIQVVRGAAQHHLGGLYATVFSIDHPEADHETVELERVRPTRAPVLLVVANRIDHAHPKIPAIEQLLSGGAVCQNLLVAAHALGYVGQWITEWPAQHDAIKIALGHAPTDDIIGFVFIGSAGAPSEERRRATINDVVTEWHAPGHETSWPTTRDDE